MCHKEIAGLPEFEDYHRVFRLSHHLSETFSLGWQLSSAHLIVVGDRPGAAQSCACPGTCRSQSQAVELRSAAIFFEHFGGHGMAKAPHDLDRSLVLKAHQICRPQIGERDRNPVPLFGWAGKEENTVPAFAVVNKVLACNAQLRRIGR
jgi:hypothetical protein